MKTYARNLAQVAHSLDYEVEALLQSARPLNPQDPVFAEVAFYEGSGRRSLVDRFVRTPLQLAFGAPFGIEAGAIPDTGVVVRPGGDVFARRYAAYNLILTARRHCRRHRNLAAVRVEQPPDLFHVTHSAPLTMRGVPVVHTIHDIIPLKLPGATLDNKRLFLNTIRAICREADHIVAVSECTKRDVIALTGVREDRITVTHQAVQLPAGMRPPTPDQAAELLANVFGLGYGEYFLFYGALEPKKNVSRLIDAYAASGVRRPLVIAGGLGWSYDEEVEQIEQERFSAWRMQEGRMWKERQVRRVSHLPLEHLLPLIQGARALLFPSLYEGFGLPALEAMTYGAPVMTSNVSSLPEVVGDAAVLVDPYDIGDMARAIATLDADADLRADLSVRGRARAERFSVESYRAKVDDVYRRVLG